MISSAVSSRPAILQATVDQVGQFQTPQPHRTVVRTCHSPAAVLGKADIEHTRFVPAQNYRRCARIRRIPKANGLILGPGGQPASIWGERQREDPACMAGQSNRLRGVGILQVEHLSGPVPRAEGQPTVVGAECRLHDTVVELQLCDQLRFGTGLDVPQPALVIEACGCGPTRVGAERNFGDSVLVRAEQARRGAWIGRRQIPQSRRRPIRRGCDVMPIRAKRGPTANRVAPARVVRRRRRPVLRHIPYVDPAAPSPADQPSAIWAEAQAPVVPGRVLGELDGRLGQVPLIPQADHPAAVTFRRQPASVRAERNGARADYRQVRRRLAVVPGRPQREVVILLIRRRNPFPVRAHRHPE